MCAGCSSYLVCLRYQGAFGAAIQFADLWGRPGRQSDGQIPLLVCGTVALTPAAIVGTPGQPDE
jgi:hypothetical protein